MSIAYDDLASKLSFGLPDRLGKALHVADVTTTDMADYLGVTRNTISNYTSGRTPVKKQTLRLWALKTGVPLEWIETGEIGETSPSGPGGVKSHTKD
ncbi:helix-turn-helix transcriptional regulator [Glaciihabitans sp. dw_435]|uniref:helix-turn-helix domain-containing protein n=1 Tax=Glaciihabitans sp. dw_435 TaxID=2720081 RepID=UPI001BD56C17|nr:helix-turn-helix transcriptional regulator [Glaciihabitans sp. dw_435]